MSKRDKDKEADISSLNNHICTKEVMPWRTNSVLALNLQMP